MKRTGSPVNARAANGGDKVPLGYARAASGGDKVPLGCARAASGGDKDKGAEARKGGCDHCKL